MKTSTLWSGQTPFEFKYATVRRLQRCQPPSLQLLSRQCIVCSDNRQPSHLQPSAVSGRRLHTQGLIAHCMNLPLHCALQQQRKPQAEQSPELGSYVDTAKQSKHKRCQAAGQRSIGQLLRAKKHTRHVVRPGAGAAADCGCLCIVYDSSRACPGRAAVAIATGSLFRGLSSKCCSLRHSTRQTTAGPLLSRH